MRRNLCRLLTVLCLGLTLPVSAKECKLSFNATPRASVLALTVTTLQHIQVGTVLQDCKDATGYNLVIESGNCLLSPAGAKLMDKGVAEFVRYTVEFDNKAIGGGIGIVSGLLAQACGGQVGRDESMGDGLLSSDVFINYSGVTTLAAGSYSDTLRVTLNLK